MFTKPLLFAAAVMLFAIAILSGCGPASNKTENAQGSGTPLPTSGKAADEAKEFSPEQIKTISLIPEEVVIAPRLPNDPPTIAGLPLQVSALLAHEDVIIYGAPGSSGNVKNLIEAAELSFASSDQDIVSVSADGFIAAGEHAKTGDSATVTVAYNGITAKAQVAIKYSLAATVIANADGVEIVTNPGDLAVVANKQRNLPADYAPDDLVVPNVPFSYKEIIEKRHLRKAAAAALEALFAAAAKDGIELYGVSGYRSYKTQQAVFAANVKRQGETEANRFSARPGQSEHQTGLAIDVSSQSAGFALEQQFGETEEGEWLARHAHEYGFIIRYPKDKEAITGYAYEPWHIRYVGDKIAAEIFAKHLALEEYFQDAVPVLGQ